MVQQWSDWGMITAEEARVHPQRNQITNCLGGVEDMFYGTRQTGRAAIRRRAAAWQRWPMGAV
jgi:serine/threonine protein phosphatase PrpC